MTKKKQSEMDGESGDDNDGKHTPRYRYHCIDTLFTMGANSNHTIHAHTFTSPSSPLDSMICNILLIPTGLAISATTASTRTRVRAMYSFPIHGYNISICLYFYFAKRTYGRHSLTPKTDVSCLFLFLSFQKGLSEESWLQQDFLHNLCLPKVGVRPRRGGVDDMLCKR